MSRPRSAVRPSAPASAPEDYTTWNVGVAFTHKAMTLDLRYYDTDLNGANAVFSPTGRNLANSTFVATLKFDTALSKIMN